ncbi:hypothetical protein Hte_006709 [Hypoxylon texense]
MALEETPFHNDSNWAFMYVVLSLIPVAFVAVAVYSTYRHRAMAARGRDVEMAMRSQPPQRPRYPWRDVVMAPERRQHSNPYEAQAAPSREQEADEHTADRNDNTTGIAVSGTYAYEMANGEPGNSRRDAPDFEAVPL